MNEEESELRNIMGRISRSWGVLSGEIESTLKEREKLR